MGRKCWCLAAILRLPPGKGHNQCHYHCEVAGCSFTTLLWSSIIRHDATIHENVRPGLNGLKCYLCSYLVIHISEYARHIARHLHDSLPDEREFVVSEINACSAIGLKDYTKPRGRGKISDGEALYIPKLYLKKDKSAKEWNRDAIGGVKSKKHTKARSKLIGTLLLDENGFSQDIIHNDKAIIPAPLRQHEGLFYCDQCAFSTTGEKSMCKHYEDMHRINLVGIFYHCKLCGYASNSRPGFIQHCGTVVHKNKITVVELEARWVQEGKSKPTFDLNDVEIPGSDRKGKRKRQDTEETVTSDEWTVTANSRNNVEPCTTPGQAGEKTKTKKVKLKDLFGTDIVSDEELRCSEEDMDTAVSTPNMRLPLHPVEVFDNQRHNIIGAPAEAEKLNTTSIKEIVSPAHENSSSAPGSKGDRNSKKAEAITTAPANSPRKKDFIATVLDLPKPQKATKLKTVQIAKKSTTQKAKHTPPSSWDAVSKSFGHRPQLSSQTRGKVAVAKKSTTPRILAKSVKLKTAQVATMAGNSSQLPLQSAILNTIPVLNGSMTVPISPDSFRPVIQSVCTLPAQTISTEERKPQVAPSFDCITIEDSDEEDNDMKVGETSLSTDDLWEELRTRNDVTQCACAEIYVDKTRYYVHRTIHDSENFLKCALCGQKAADKFSVYAHIADHRK